MRWVVVQKTNTNIKIKISTKVPAQVDHLQVQVLDKKVVVAADVIKDKE